MTRRALASGGILLAALSARAAGPDAPLVIGGHSFERHEVALSELTAGGPADVALDVDRRGTAVVAWSGRLRQDGSRGIWSRRIERDGRLAGPEERASLDIGSSQVRPAVAVSPDGTVLIAWDSPGQDGDRGSVVGRSGGGEILLSRDGAGDQRDVVVAPLAHGEWVAAWDADAGRGARSIFVRRLSLGADPVGGEIALPVPQGARDRLPTVAPGRDGGFVVAWARSTAEGVPLGILARRFDTSGAAIGRAVLISRPDQPAVEPSIASRADGGFAVAYLARDGAGYEVWVRRFDCSGAPDGDALQVSNGSGTHRSGAAIAMAADGRFAVAWNEASAHDHDVKVRWFDAAGHPLSAVLPVGAPGAARMLGFGSGARRLALGDDGRLAVAWQGSTPDDRKTVNLTLFTPVPAAPSGAGARPPGDRAPATSPSSPAAAPYRPPTHDPSVAAVSAPNDARATAAGIAFTGFTDTGWDPPDPHLAVGPGNLVIAVNGGIAGRGRDGSLLWEFPIAGVGGFWAPIGAGTFVFDPEVIFDPLSGRFFALANERAGASAYLLLAVSSTSDATDFWHKYRFNVTSLGGPDIDSPSIGVDSEVVYLTADFLTPVDQYLFYMIEKASILTGGPAERTAVVHSGTKSFGVPSMYSAEAPGMYFLEAFEGLTESTVRFWTVVDPLGTPSLQSVTLPVPTYHRPALIPCQGTSTSVNPFGARFWSCMYRDGSVWASHHAGTDSTSGARTVSRWYEFAMNGWPASGVDPVLRHSGTQDPGPGIHTSFSSVFADGAANAAMVMARSAPDEFFSIVRSHRTGGEPLGQMGNLVTAVTGDSPPSGLRWGDYSAIVADPVVPGSFWYHHEYSIDGSWRTQVEQFGVGAAVAAPVSAAPRLDGVEVAPSPSAGPTRISLSVAEPGSIELDVFTVDGRLVRHFGLGSVSAGAHEVQWDGRDDDGTRVPAGIYFTRALSNGRLVGAKRIVILR